MAAKEAKDHAKHADAQTKAAAIRTRVSTDAMKKAKAMHLGTRDRAKTKEELRKVTESFVKIYKKEMHDTVDMLKDKSHAGSSAGRLEEARKLAASNMVTTQILNNNFKHGAELLIASVTGKRDPLDAEDQENRAALAEAKKQLEKLKAGVSDMLPTQVKQIKQLVFSTLNASKQMEKLKTPAQKDSSALDLIVKNLEGKDKDPAANTSTEDAIVIKKFNATAKKGNDNAPGFNISKGDAGLKKDNGDDNARARRAFARIAAGNHSVSEKLAADEVKRKAASDELDEAAMMDLMAQKMSKAKENADGQSGPGVLLLNVPGANDSVAFRIAFKADVASAMNCKESRVKIDAIKAGMVLFYFTGNKNDSALATGPALKDDFIDLVEDNKLNFKSVRSLIQMPVMPTLTNFEQVGVFNKTNVTAAGMAEATGRSLTKVLGVLKKLTKPGKKAKALAKKSPAGQVAARVNAAKARAVAKAKSDGKSEVEAQFAGEEAAAAMKIASSPEAAKKAATAAAIKEGKTEEEAAKIGDEAAKSTSEANTDGDSEKEAAEDEVGEIDDAAPEADAHVGKKNKTSTGSAMSSKLAAILGNLTRIPGVADQAVKAGVNMTEVAAAEEEAAEEDEDEGSITKRIVAAMKNATANASGNASGNASSSDDEEDDNATMGNSSVSPKKITASSGIKAALLKLGVDSSNDAAASTVVQVTISLDYDWVAANKESFQVAFAKDVGAALNIDTARIEVTKVRPAGSTIVTFTILSALTNETADGQAEQSSSALSESLVHMGATFRLANVELISGVQSFVEGVSWKVMESTSEEEKQAMATDAIASKIGSLISGNGTGCGNNTAKAVEDSAGDDDEASARKASLPANISSLIDRLVNNTAPAADNTTDLSAALASLQAEQKVRESTALQELQGVLNMTGRNASDASGNLSDMVNSSLTTVENETASFLETARMDSVRSAQRSRWMSHIFASLKALSNRK